MPRRYTGRNVNNVFDFNQEKEILEKQKAEGVTRKLVGFEMMEKGIPRHGYEIHDSESGKIGVVTSGTQSPSLGKAIGMGYLPVEHTAIDTEFDVDIRGRRTRARVVAMPFYKRRSSS